jgi:para-aminobenzoate synthetase component 2
MILVIDHYDSFVFNLARYFEELGFQSKVIRYDQLSIQKINQLQPSHLVFSPGPNHPKDVSMSIELVRTFAGKIPILGICLGHQVIAHVFGAEIVRAKKPMHGKSCLIEHECTGIFQDLPNPLTVGRYHSLIVSEQNLDPILRIASRSAEGEMMSLVSEDLKLVGLQFHPESILTQCGHQLLKNFTALSRSSPQKIKSKNATQAIFVQAQCQQSINT